MQEGVATVHDGAAVGQKRGHLDGLARRLVDHVDVIGDRLGEEPIARQAQLVGIAYPHLPLGLGESNGGHLGVLGSTILFFIHVSKVPPFVGAVNKIDVIVIHKLCTLVDSK